MLETGVVTPRPPQPSLQPRAALSRSCETTTHPDDALLPERDSECAVGGRQEWSTPLTSVQSTPCCPSSLHAGDRGGDTATAPAFTATPRRALSILRDHHAPGRRPAAGARQRMCSRWQTGVVYTTNQRTVNALLPEQSPCWRQGW